LFTDLVIGASISEKMDNTFIYDPAISGCASIGGKELGDNCSVPERETVPLLARETGK
jgi:hypothetical protein